MGLTLAQKILAAHCGKAEVSPGDLINVKVDLVMANDVTAPIAIEQYRRLGVSDVFDKERVVFVPSHFVPPRDIATAVDSDNSVSSSAKPCVKSMATRTLRARPAGHSRNSGP